MREKIVGYRLEEQRSSRIVAVGVRIFAGHRSKKGSVMFKQKFHRDIPLVWKFQYLALTVIPNHTVALGPSLFWVLILVVGILGNSVRSG